MTGYYLLMHEYYPQCLENRELTRNLFAVPLKNSEYKRFWISELKE